MFLPTAILVLLIAIYGDASEQTGSFTNGLYYKKVGSSWFYGKGEQYNPDHFSNNMHIKMITVDVTEDKEVVNAGKVIVGVKIYKKSWIDGNELDIPKNPVVNMQLEEEKMYITFNANILDGEYNVAIYC